MDSDQSSRYSHGDLTSSSSSINSYQYNEDPVFPVSASPRSFSSFSSASELQVRNRRLLSNENIELLRECLANANKRTSQYKGYTYEENNELALVTEYNQSQSIPTSSSNTNTTSTSGPSSPTTPRILRSSHHMSRHTSVPVSPSPHVMPVLDTSVVNSEKQKEIITTALKVSDDFFKTVTYLLNNSDNNSNGQLILQKEQLDLLKASLHDSTKELAQLQTLSDEVGPELGEPRDWNEEYQQCLRLPQDNAELRAKRFKAIATVAQNFEHSAQTYGRIIISEVFVPAKYRTIKPFTDIGGNAGGEKYIYNGILFKFATDWKGIYGGDHEAMKAASHEMLSLMTVQNCDLEAICTPLMTLIDYLGFRLTAMSLLPVSDNTLIYGSSDGGRYVCAEDPEVNQLMDQLSKKLNLASHVAGMVIEDSKTIGLPVDIEGHRGEDGRFYLLDLARVMPPTMPVPSLKSCFLYRLFRPEFIRQYHKALSSDAYSPRFDVHEPNRLEHATAIKSATDYLLNSSIPKIATMMQRQMAETATAFDAIHFLRAQGVNTRYLAVVRKHMQSSYFKQLFLIEMVARGLKNFIRELLRETKRSKKVLSQEPYREVLIEVFNQLLGNFQYAGQTIDLWTQLHKRLLVYFPGFPTHAELVSEAPTPAIQAGFAILNRICPAVFVGDKQVPIGMHECYTCGLMSGQGICSVCAEECHAKRGHSVSRNPNLTRGAAYCDCTQEVTCPCVSTNRAASSFDEAKLSDVVQCPLRYMILQTGIHRVVIRVQEMTGIRFSKTALEDLKDHRREFVFVSPDIESLQPRIKKLPIVSVAEAQAFRLTAKMLAQPQERYRLYKQSRQLLKESLLINPGRYVFDTCVSFKSKLFSVSKCQSVKVQLLTSNSVTLLNTYADLCIEMAHNSEDNAYASQMLEKALRVYRVLKNKDAVKILLVDLIASKRPFTSVVFQNCFDIVLSQSLSHVTAKDIQFIAEYGEGLETLNFDGSSIIDDSLLIKIAPKCQKLTSLRLGYCYKLTRTSIIAVLNMCGPVLQELVLDGNLNIDDEFIRALPKKCPNLVHLSLVAVESLSAELARQVPWMKKLTCLNLNFTSIDTPLYSTSLRVLRLHKSKVSLNSAKYMLRWSPLLKHMDVSWCQNITNGASLLLSVLKHSSAMKIFAIDGVPLTLDEKIVRDMKAIPGPRPTLCVSSMTEADLVVLQECGFSLQASSREQPAQ